MIELRPLTQQQFDAFLSESIASYADDKVEAGNCSRESAVESSRAEFLALLPDGLQTKDHYLFSLHDTTSRQSVGILWVAIRHREGIPEVFIYDIQVDDDKRGRGYGSQALAALEHFTRKRGIHKISLHVFGHNQRAWQLYRRLGFVETNILMSKQI